MMLCPVADTLGQQCGAQLVPSAARKRAQRQHSTALGYRLLNLFGLFGRYVAKARQRSGPLARWRSRLRLWLSALGAFGKFVPPLRHREEQRPHLRQHGCAHGGKAVGGVLFICGGCGHALLRGGLFNTER
jgi:hypothetical protein